MFRDRRLWFGNFTFLFHHCLRRLYKTVLIVVVIRHTRLIKCCKAEKSQIFLDSWLLVESTLFFFQLSAHRLKVKEALLFVLFQVLL